MFFFVNTEVFALKALDFALGGSDKPTRVNYIVMAKLLNTVHKLGSYNRVTEKVRGQQSATLSTMSPLVLPLVLSSQSGFWRLVRRAWGRKSGAKKVSYM